MTAMPTHSRESAGQEVANGRGDLRGMRLQREVPGVKEPHHRVRDVAPERLGAGRQEERIVLPPHRQEARLMGPEVVLKCRVKRDVTLVVTEQVELHLIGTGPSEIEIVERVTVRRDLR